MSWQPKTIVRFIRGFATSTRTALVETDCGLGYLKALGNPEPSHVLASEWIATELAAWFRLPVFDHAIISVEPEDEIPIVDEKGQGHGRFALPGPAYITRAEIGTVWSGVTKQLDRIINPGDISRLIVFDTWILNRDRHCISRTSPPRSRINRDNVFLSAEAPAGQFLLKAMDHTHCFSSGSEWNRRLSDLGTIRDGRVFGRFPEFHKFLDRAVVSHSSNDLRMLERGIVQSIVDSVPREWLASRTAMEALVELIVRRARFVAETIEQRLWPQKSLPFSDPASTEPQS